MLRAILSIIRRWRYPGAAAYWERRYKRGGDSGSGSTGVLAAYKQQIIQGIVRQYAIRKVVELGCGDGRQLLLADYPAYTGLDISPAAVACCRARFAGDPTKTFAVYNPATFDPAGCRATLSLSLEVVFHLTEQALYERYLEHLFALSERYVLIFSSDRDDRSGGMFPHFRERRFSTDLHRLAPGWQLIRHIPNPHRDISVSDFFLYEKY